MIKPASKIDKRVKAATVRKTARSFDISEDYVRKIERGDKDNEEVLRFYRSTYAELEKVML